MNSFLGAHSFKVKCCEALRRFSLNSFSGHQIQNRGFATKKAPNPVKKEQKSLRRFTFGNGGKSAGRNSAGRITIWHRGGGAKRLQRTLDMKRTTPSMGIVERIEYDPNRSSRIALVRWIEGVHQKKFNKIEEVAAPLPQISQPTTTSVRGLFSFASMPGMVNLRTDDVGPGLKDVFLSTLSLSKSKGETASLSPGLPRIAVAGAKPGLYAPRMRQFVEEENKFSLGDVQKWNVKSAVWKNRMKRKAALSWHSVAEKSKPKVKKPDSEKLKNRAPVSYILASNNLEVGKIVMNTN